MKEKNVTRDKGKIIRETTEGKQPCGKKCRLRCTEIISEEQKQVIFDSYWAEAKDEPSTAK